MAGPCEGRHVQRVVAGRDRDARAAALHGKPAEDGSHSLEDWLAAIVPEDRHIAEVHFFNYNVAGSAYETQYRVVAEDGTVRHLRSIGSFYTDAAGADKTIGIVWDVTADAEAAETLRKAKDVSDIKNAELEMALDESVTARGRTFRALRQAGSGTRLLSMRHLGTRRSAIEGSIWDDRMHELYGLKPRARLL